jgi:hypothetical protein
LRQLVEVSAHTNIHQKIVRFEDDKGFSHRHGIRSLDFLNSSQILNSFCVQKHFLILVTQYAASSDATADPASLIKQHGSQVGGLLGSLIGRAVGGYRGTTEILYPFPIISLY